MEGISSFYIWIDESASIPQLYLGLSNLRGEPVSTSFPSVSWITLFFLKEAGSGKRWLVVMRGFDLLKGVDLRSRGTAFSPYLNLNDLGLLADYPLLPVNNLVFVFVVPYIGCNGA